VISWRFLGKRELTNFPPEEENPDPSEWLLRNLFNPYPQHSVRFSAGRTAGSKSIKDWFAKARQRIGWTRLLRDQFAGCRSVAIAAAFRVFVRDDPADPLDMDLKTAFLAIKSHAELVYGPEGTPSPSSSGGPPDTFLEDTPSPSSSKRPPGTFPDPYPHSVMNWYGHHRKANHTWDPAL